MSCEAGDVDGDDEAGIIVYSRFRALTRPLIFTDKSDKEVTEDPFPIGRRL